jgi:hypothetical protein
MAESTRQDLLRRAVELMGRDALASRLNVPNHLLDTWLNGHASIPDRKLLALIDILDKVSSRPGI